MNCNYPKPFMKPTITRLRSYLLIASILWSGALQFAGAQQSVDQSSDNGLMAPGSGAGGQSLDYQADLFSGRFTYSVPIRVPPGRQGSEPKLALGYNSAAGNGWCGVGWMLNVGSIQRDNRAGVPLQWHQAIMGSPSHPFTLEYNLPSYAYDDTKGFVSSFGSGGALVRVSAPGENPQIYRQQVDTTFLTYSYFTNDNHWEVIDKGGTTYYFGESVAGRMENTNTNWTPHAGASTYRWALERVLDVNGNETFLKYLNDAGSLYLTNITYNANTNSPVLPATHEIDFVLGDRSDKGISFLSGYRVEARKLLKEIQIKAGGANVRKYVLNYAASPSSLRSLLVSVTEYGSDFSTALPPATFSYQTKPFAFGAVTNWGTLYSQGQTSSPWNCIRGVDGNNDTHVMMCDIDADGLPDRVERSASSPFNFDYWAERNTGASITNLLRQPFGGGSWPEPYKLGALDTQGQTGAGWASPVSINGDGATIADLFDINGDSYPDRVMRKVATPFTSFYVQLNTGYPYTVGTTNTFSSAVLWTNVDDYETDNADWLSVRFKTVTDMIDMNGDGLPDRVSRKVNSPYDCFKVQLNTGAGFTRAMLWRGLDSQGKTDSGWNGISAIDGNGRDYVILADINGDGLPDRIMKSVNSAYTNWVVQFNNGAGFDPAENWGPLDNQSSPGDSAWGSPVGSNGGDVWSTLVDINGDGLPDHVMRQKTLSFGAFASQWWIVQLNTGSGFGPSVAWKGLDGQGSTDYSWYSVSARSGGDTYVDFFDINGDGLPDRVMRSAGAPYDHFVVQLNKGPFPDLLNVASNGLGGSVKVSYASSTTLDNRDRDWLSDPWKEGTKNLLPLNVWVVSQIVGSDGMGTQSTNTYSYKGGFFDPTEKDFRGFSQVTVTDPLGIRTTTYYHQSGGRDNSALGEYADPGSRSKKGIPFRVDIVGSDGLTNKIVLSKVEEAELNSNGWYFPYVSQTITMNYEGLGNYRARAERFTYDTNSENVVQTCSFGEVTNVVVSSQSFTDIGNDSVYRQITYADLGNIRSKPSDIKVTSDSAGTAILREQLLRYDSRGNLTNMQLWLDNPVGTYVNRSSISYDQYGNPVQVTDAAGITSTTVYDPGYRQSPILQITGTFTNQSVYDARSGMALMTVDAKGLVTSNAYDVFFHPTAVYISTTPYGAPTLWKTKISYSFGGMVDGVSQTYVRRQANDALDAANGYETYTYADGLGRIIQSRSEAENGQFRVAATCYDVRGNPYFQTLPYFSSGAGFSVVAGAHLGTLTEFDGVGRAFRVTPAIQGNFTNGTLQGVSATGGDASSPVGATTTTFGDGNDPWAVAVTDSEGKIRKSYSDAYGRIVMSTEVTAATNLNTRYRYDLIGNLTNVIDSAGNSSVMVFDSLGRKISTLDPDMGLWSYHFDNAGRITQQTDARNNKLQFSYDDPLGRITSRAIYNSSNQLKGTITYTYDVSDDPNYTAFKGQLYKVTDLQGYQRNSYDVRGRILKSARFINVNAMEYVTQTTYDDADRVQTVTYPGNAAVVQYSYDTGGNLNHVQSLAGTGTPEMFYTPAGFNELGQPLGYTAGNGVSTTNTYYANSKRLHRVLVSKGTNSLQDLSYTYDTVSDLKSIEDGAHSGGASASLSNIVYDDLYRVTSFNSSALGNCSYSYDSIGNILTNRDSGTGLYQYGSKPHAVLSANGRSYAYDACGNMIARGSQTLIYDEQNQLVQVSNAGTNVLFGYAEGGERLWSAGTKGYSLWIGGIYEINSGKVLCHVLAGGKRLATFEPQCNSGLAASAGWSNWSVVSTALRSVMDWPFKNGRSQISLLIGSWLAILGLCFGLTRSVRVGRREFRRAFKPARLWWNQAVTFILISALLWTSTTTVEAATPNPVFYYYHDDNLGSSNVLTDRSGNVVQHYEYSAFGKTSYSANPSGFQVSNRYTGQIFDDETGLYYCGARFYDPELGRFTQADTLVQSPFSPQTLNRYSYCANNPLNRIDPTGHSFFSSIAHFFSTPLGMGLGLAFGLGALWGVFGEAVQRVVQIGCAWAAIGAAMGAALDPRHAAIAAREGAYNSVASAVPIVGPVVLAAIQGRDVGRAAIMATISLAFEFATAGIGSAVVGAISKVVSITGAALEFVEFAAYTAVQVAGNAAEGALKAVVAGTDPGRGALQGAIGAAESAGMTFGMAIVRWCEGAIGLDLPGLGGGGSGPYGIKLQTFSDLGGNLLQRFGEPLFDPQTFLKNLAIGAAKGALRGFENYAKKAFLQYAEHLLGFGGSSAGPLSGAMNYSRGASSPAQMLGSGGSAAPSADINQHGSVSLQVDYSGH